MKTMAFIFLMAVAVASGQLAVNLNSGVVSQAGDLGKDGVGNSKNAPWAKQKEWGWRWVIGPTQPASLIGYTVESWEWVESTNDTDYASIEEVYSPWPKSDFQIEVEQDLTNAVLDELTLNAPYIGYTIEEVKRSLRNKIRTAKSLGNPLDNLLDIYNCIYLLETEFPNNWNIEDPNIGSQGI